MNAQEAAAVIRDKINIEAVAPVQRHQVKFLEEVAAALGVAATPLNIIVIGAALADEGIEIPSGEKYPLVLYTKLEPAPELGAEFLARYKTYSMTVATEEERAALGDGWSTELDTAPASEAKADPKDEGVAAQSDPAASTETDLNTVD